MNEVGMAKNDKCGVWGVGKGLQTKQESANNLGATCIVDSVSTKGLLF